MADYGRALEFGMFLTPDAGNVPGVLRLAQSADAAGLDLLGIQDHPYQASFLDTWTLLSAIGGRTESIRLFPDVANLPLRQPAVLAKAVASLDLLTGGRAELGLGAGAFWDAIAALGGPRRRPREAVDALSEAIDVIRLWWSGRRAVSYRGEFYQLAGAQPGPLPQHPVGIWLGSYGPRMLALTGAKADGWLPSMGYLPPDGLPDANARIDDAAGAAGRDPA